MSTTVSTLQTFSIFLLLPYLISAQVEATFSIYPEASQQCLNDAADSSGCPLEGTLYSINSCLCGNDGSFITNSAICIANNDPADLQNVWTTMVTACYESETPIAYSESEFLNAGKTSTTPTTMITTTRAPSSSATAADNQVTTTESQTSESTTSAASSTLSSSSNSNANSNSNNNGDGVGHLSGGMIALISCVATVAALLITVGICCGCARRPCYG